jgi:hypothetical protein
MPPRRCWAGCWAGWLCSRSAASLSSRPSDGWTRRARLARCPSRGESSVACAYDAECGGPELNPRGPPGARNEVRGARARACACCSPWRARTGAYVCTGRTAGTCLPFHPPPPPTPHTHGPLPPPTPVHTLLCPRPGSCRHRASLPAPPSRPPSPPPHPTPAPPLQHEPLREPGPLRRPGPAGWRRPRRRRGQGGGAGGLGERRVGRRRRVGREQRPGGAGRGRAETGGDGQGRAGTGGDGWGRVGTGVRERRFVCPRQTWTDEPFFPPTCLHAV